MRKRGGSAAAVALAVVGATVALAGPAQADSGDYTGILRNWQQGNCLDIRPGTDLVYASPCVSGDTWQEWYVPGVANLNYVPIVNQATGECLDIEPGTWNGVAGSLYISGCVPGDSWQQWTVTISVGGDGGNDAWEFQNGQTGGCIYDPSGSVSVPYDDLDCYAQPSGLEEWKDGF